MVMVLWSSTMRWNHYLMGWGGLASRSPRWFWLMCFMRSHIHAWNMARGWLTKKIFGSAVSTIGWNVVVPYRVGFCIINMRLFLFVISWVLYWFICLLYGYCFIGIYVVIMLVMNMYYESGYVWIPSCFYMYMNEQCIYGLMDETVANVLVHQCFLVILR